MASSIKEYQAAAAAAQKAEAEAWSDYCKAPNSRGQEAKIWRRANEDMLAANQALVQAIATQRTAEKLDETALGMSMAEAVSTGIDGLFPTGVSFASGLRTIQAAKRLLLAGAAEAAALQQLKKALPTDLPQPPYIPYQNRGRSSGGAAAAPSAPYVPYQNRTRPSGGTAPVSSVPYVPYQHRSVGESGPSYGSYPQPQPNGTSDALNEKEDEGSWNSGSPRVGALPAKDWDDGPPGTPTASDGGESGLDSPAAANPPITDSGAIDPYSFIGRGLQLEQGYID